MLNKSLAVLIVEDSEDDSLLLIRELRRAGYALEYEIVYAETAMRTALAGRDWDMVISDFNMPNFSGLAALEIVKQHKRDIPFIIVSGVIGEEVAVEAMKAGANDYLMKGNLARLIPAVERELREAHSRAARRTAEHARVESEQRYRLLAENVIDVIWTLNPQAGRFTYFSPSVEKLLGMAAEQAMTRSPEQLLTPDSMGVVRSAFNEIVAARSADISRSRTLELEWLKDDQSTVWTEVIISLMEPFNGEVRLLGVTRDITERKQLEAEIQRHTEQLEDMVEERTTQLRQVIEQIEAILYNSSDAIVLTDPNGDIQRVNPAFKSMFDDRVTKSIEQILQLLPQEMDIERFATGLMSVIHDGSPNRVELSLLSKNGDRIDADLALTPVTEIDDEIAGVVLSLRDITHMKEVDRLKARFVDNAAHDLANPIAALRTRLYLIKQSPEKLSHHLNIFENQVERLEHLVEDLRTLSLLDRGEVPLDLSTFDFNELVASIIEAQMPHATAKQQVIAFQPDENIPDIIADQRKCERIAVNLIANAINYTPEMGTVTIITQSSKTHIIFTVQDTGLGIHPHDLPFIFERFYRSDAAEQADDKGTGLGLAIVKEMAAAHNGIITVESTPSICSIFTVTLPLRQ